MYFIIAFEKMSLSKISYSCEGVAANCITAFFRLVTRLYPIATDDHDVAVAEAGLLIVILFQSRSSLGQPSRATTRLRRPSSFAGRAGRHGDAGMCAATQRHQ